MINELSEQEIFRRQAAEQLRQLGIEPYPAALYPVNAKTNEILEQSTRSSHSSQPSWFNLIKR